MPWTLPKGLPPRSRNLSPAPLFTLEGDNIPRHTLPAGRLSPDVAQHAVLDLLRHLGDRGMGAAVTAICWTQPSTPQAPSGARPAS